MKKILLIIVTIFSLLTLASCGGGEKLLTNGGVQTTSVRKSGKRVVEKLDENKYKPQASGDLRFEGWFKSARGRWWGEQNPIKFPLELKEGEKDPILYPVFRPLNSKTHRWSKAETYRSGVTMSTEPILNPLTYTQNYENAFMNMLSTFLYERDIDWDKAIKDKIADHVGDFSKIQGSAINKFVTKYELRGATSYPTIQDAGEFQGTDGTHAGKFNENIASTQKGKRYRITLNPNIKWEDGTPVTAHDYVYSYLQYIDPVQLNSRSNGMYPSGSRKSGAAIVNARKYFSQGQTIGAKDKDGKYIDKESNFDFSEKILTKLVTSKVTKIEIKVGTVDYKLDLPVNTTLWEGSQTTSGLINQTALTEAQVKGLFGQIINSMIRTNDDLYNAIISAIKQGKKAEAFAAVTKALIEATILPSVSQNEYYVGKEGDKFPEVKKEDVGIRAIDDYTLEIEYEKEVTVKDVFSDFGQFKLVNKKAYEASLDKDRKNSTYGTEKNHPVSYGTFTIADWAPGKYLRFNKNFAHQYAWTTNYKSVQYTYFAKENDFLNAFKQGEIDNLSIRKDYYKERYSEEKVKQGLIRKSIIGAPTIMVPNPLTDTQDEYVKRLIKNVNFRKALYMAVNREGLKGIHPTSDPIFTPVPANATQFDTDELYYVQRPQYKSLLEKSGIGSGYDPVKAKELYEKALKEVGVPENHRMTFRLSAPEIEYLERASKYIKETFERIFKNITIDVKLEKDNDNTIINNRFELQITAVGGTNATNLSVMNPLFMFFFRTELSAKFGIADLADFGENFDDTKYNVEPKDKIDLTATYRFLQELEAQGKINKETDGGTLWPLYETLKKNNGYFVGSLRQVVEFGIKCQTVWAGSAPQYPGEVEDRNRLVDAFLKIYFQTFTQIPLFNNVSYSELSQRVISPRIKVEHNIFGFGQQRYSHLNTDPDWKNLTPADYGWTNPK